MLNRRQIERAVHTGLVDIAVDNGLEPSDIGWNLLL